MTIVITVEDQETISCKRLYALIYQGSRGDLCRVGPFASREALSVWSEAWQRLNGDDPYWTEIQLEVPDSAAAVYHLPTYTPGYFYAR